MDGKGPHEHRPAADEETRTPLPRETSAPLDSGAMFDGSKAAVAPTQIGPYKILSTLGEGGMGTVYKALQREPIERHVALKVIRPGVGNRQTVARFESERQALALMNHTNIARVFDAGTTEYGQPYFAMEHIDGVPLTAYCDAKKLTIQQRLQLYAAVCEGIQHAHQKGIIHRDLKPSNILVITEGDKPVPKIIDFGIAKAVHGRLTEQTLLTELGSPIGTPGYMSPEQAHPGRDDIDTRTDVYALGVVLYELLTGKLPIEIRDFPEVGVGEILRRISEDEPRRPSTLLRESGKPLTTTAETRSTTATRLHRLVEGDLDWITMRAIEKDPARRYATVQALGADVERHLTNERVLARPPTLTYRLQKLIRKHRGRFAAALLLVVGLTGYATAAWYMDRRERVHDGRRLLTAASLSWERFRSHDSELGDALAKLREANNRYERWQPIWEQVDTVSALAQIPDHKRSAERFYNDAVTSVARALQVAPRGSAEHLRARRELEQIHWDLLQKATAEGGINLSRDFFRWMVESQDLGTFEGRLGRTGRIRLKSVPAGAAVHCFRYEKVEEHLLPLPFDPHVDPEDLEKGFVGTPLLIVDRIDPVREELPFRKADRLRTVRGVPVGTRGELARALQGVSAGEDVAVTLLRDGAEHSLSWTPFPDPPTDETSPFTPGRVVDIYHQFGFALAGYPLELRGEPTAGVTSPSHALKLTLAEGSYLFVFKKPGFVETRLPVVIPGNEEGLSVRLFREEAVPEGYVHVPGGPFGFGGDEHAYQGLPRGTARVDDFFMARYEVTLRDYLGFMNDPAVIQRTDTKNGVLAPAADWDGEELRRFQPGDDAKITLIPYYRATPWCQYDEEQQTWRLRQGAPEDWPVLGISFHAAVEYAHWKNMQRGPRPRWRFRLPGDLEWEKAARGVDRRLFVWGNHLVWSFCDSAQGSFGRRGEIPNGIGRFPLDESVYGIRDLAGSISEPVLELASSRIPFCVRRGGNWNATDFRDYRIPTRNRGLISRPYIHVGLRLVAEPVEQTR